MISDKNVFVISHPRLKEERKKKFNSQANEVGLSVSYCDLVDSGLFKDINNNPIPVNTKLTEPQIILFKEHIFNYFPHNIPIINNKTCGTNYIACTMSHMFMYKKLIEDDNHDFYLIFEDDFRFSKKFSKKILIKCISDLPSDFDVCLFSPSHAHKIMAPFGKSVTDDIYKIQNPYAYSGVSMYVVSKQYAKKILSKYGFNFMFVSDDHLSFLSLTNHLNAYSSYNIFGFGAQDEYCIELFDLV